MATPENIDFTLTTLPGQVSHANVKSLIEKLRVMHDQIQVSEFLFELNAPPEDLIYTYKIDLYDGRSWTQTINFSVNRGDPGMTFSVSDYWALSEFQTQRAVRDAVVALMQVADVEKLEYTGAQA